MQNFKLKKQKIKQKLLYNFLIFIRKIMREEHIMKERKIKKEIVMEEVNFIIQMVVITMGTGRKDKFTDLEVFIIKMVR